MPRGNSGDASRQRDEAAKEALKNGATSANQIAEVTGMTPAQARAALNHLESTGQAELQGTQPENKRWSFKFRPKE